MSHSRSCDRVSLRSTTASSSDVEGATNTFENYHADRHVLISRPQTPGTPERLEGISGSSLWLTFHGGLSVGNWTADKATVVAVQTGTYKNGSVVKATRWWIVTKVIEKYYPELCPALQLLAI